MRLAKPGGPHVLVIGGYHAEDASSPAIIALGELFKRETGHAADAMTIEPLSATESRAAGALPCGRAKTVRVL